MASNAQHEAALWHENAAKAHLIAAKHCEESARAERDGAPGAKAKPVAYDDAWYHAEALQDSAPTRRGQ